MKKVIALVAVLTAMVFASGVSANSKTMDLNFCAYKRSGIVAALTFPQRLCNAFNSGFKGTRFTGHLGSAWKVRCAFADPIHSTWILAIYTSDVYLGKAACAAETRIAKQVGWTRFK